MFGKIVAGDRVLYKPLWLYGRASENYEAFNVIQWDRPIASYETIMHDMIKPVYQVRGLTLHKYKIKN